MEQGSGENLMLVADSTWVKGTGPGRARSPQAWSTFLKNQQR